jgi:hypothetical protein
MGKKTALNPRTGKASCAHKATIYIYLTILFNLKSYFFSTPPISCLPAAK